MSYPEKIVAFHTFGDEKITNNDGNGAYIVCRIAFLVNLLFFTTFVPVAIIVRLKKYLGFNMPGFSEKPGMLSQKFSSLYLRCEENFGSLRFAALSR